MTKKNENFPLGWCPGSADAANRNEFYLVGRKD
jgi:hypothetical protein